MATAVRPSTQDMVIVHRLFRREYRLAPQLVRAVADGDTARAAVVGAHLTELGEMLHHHHTGEDELVWPRLHERASLHNALISRMEREHEAVDALLTQVADALAAWTPAATAAARDELAAALEALGQQVAAHLDGEEREVLPIIEEHLTMEEWAEVGQRGAAGLPKARMLVLLGGILEDASDAERRDFLAHMPPPVRVLYKVVGKRRYDKETAVLRSGIVPAQREG